MATTTIVGPGGTGSIKCQSVLLVENGAGTINADFYLPANSVVLDVIVKAEVLWGAGTAADLVIGDANDVDGYVASTSLKATDLLAGESIRVAGSTFYAGGKIGAYMTAGSSTHQWMGPTAGAPTTTPVTGIDTDRLAVRATVVTSGTAATTGRTRIFVVYATFGGARATL